MKGRRWEDVERDLLRRTPELDDPELQAAAEAELDAYVTGYRLKELRESQGVTQKELAKRLHVTQARISQIENGRLDVMGLDTLRTYVAALGGHLDITAHVGQRAVRVA